MTNIQTYCEADANQSGGLHARSVNPQKFSIDFIRLKELIMQRFGVLELYLLWFATKTRFLHEQNPENHLGLIFGVPGSK